MKSLMDGSVQSRLFYRWSGLSRSGKRAFLLWSYPVPVIPMLLYANVGG